MKNKEKLIFGSKIRNIVIATIISLFAFVGVVYASVRYVTTRDEGQPTTTGYRINNNVTLNIDKGTKCRKVRNTSGVSYFIPTKTTNEWYTFLNKKPSGVTINTECYIPSGTKGASRWHVKPNTDHIDICIHGKCSNWYTNDYGVDNVTLLKKYSNYYIQANSSNREVKRGSLHHNGTDTRKYYYIIER